MTARTHPTATFVTRILTHYRVPFHEKLRDLLALEGVAYRLLYGSPDQSEVAKGDLAQIEWAEQVSQTTLLRREKLVWQHVARHVWHDDLVILGQENQLLVNYPLQAMRSLGGPKLALFGHGRNFQSRNPVGRAERWKAFWATRCDWWFAYTEETRRYIEALGFPGDRITVFNNTVDTRALRDDLAAVDHATRAALRKELGLIGSNIGVFVGGIYEEKRIEFLIKSCDQVRAQVPDFELLILGGGQGFDALCALAGERAWIKTVGPQFGARKAAMMSLGKLFLMPGLLGLAVQDAGIGGLPVVTTAYPWHSPEIAYLTNGENCRIVEDWRSEGAYAETVINLLKDEAARTRMANRARSMASARTIEEMAARFAKGIALALAADPQT
tara:strand:+ start:3216 stop:4373 length:1158 start_codon:yes stop_codon:yes gene_type:complete